LKAFLISGLAADKKAFQKLQLPPGYEAVHLDWINPLKNESLRHYAQRLGEIIPPNEPFILIGLSFGGMIAVEIARIKMPQKTIIISSIPKATELPWYFKQAGKLGLHKIIPVGFLKSATVLNHLVSAGGREDKAVIYHYVRHASPDFIRWSLQAIINWEMSERLPGVIHLHGDRDHLLPVKYLHPDYIVKNGGHLMVLNRAGEVNRILKEVLEAGVAVSGNLLV
jgi:pimeloyl-ACP methyl ester carboxylesterase